MNAWTSDADSSLRAARSGWKQRRYEERMTIHLDSSYVACFVIGGDA